MDSASTVGISLSELITVGVFIVGVLWALGKLGMNQYLARMDEKFKASDTRNDDRFKTIDSKLQTFDPLHGELARVDRDLLQIRLDVSERLEQYIKSDALQRLDDKITRLFGEVFDKLDSKADKAECQREHSR